MKKLALIIASSMIATTSFAASGKTISIVANNQFVDMLVKTQICTFSSADNKNQSNKIQSNKKSPPASCVDGPSLKFDESSPNIQEITIPDNDSTFLHVASVMADFIQTGKKIVTTTTYPEAEFCAAYNSSEVIILNDFKTSNIVVCQHGHGKIELTK